MNEVTVGVVGATGAVGQELLQLFLKRKWNISQLKLFASQRSSGKIQSWKNISIPIHQTDLSILQKLDLVFLSAGSGISKEISRDIVAQGCIAIDNSSAFRMTSDVPLIVPEINSEAIKSYDRLIANPNCSAIIMLMAVAPLRKLGKIRRIIVSTYQSASGAGASAMQELLDQTATFLTDREKVKPSVFQHPIAFNLFSHDTDIQENGYNVEENKIIEETRKILADEEILVNPTCIRVPILRAHSESITVEFEDSAPTVEEVTSILADAPGVRLVNDAANNTFPMPLDASGQDDVLVGRIRADITNDKAINLFVSGDQLLKGAALNAVQIGELMISKGYVRSS